MLFRLETVVLVACLSAGLAPQAQISPVQIDEAIAAGKTGKFKPMSVQIGPGFDPVRLGLVLTPYSRVALASKAAADAYKPFTADDVTEAMLDPLVQVVAWPYEQIAGDPLRRYCDVAHVVLIPKGGQPIQPVATSQDLTVLQNAFGAQIGVKGMIASFPRGSFTADTEIVIVYDKTNWLAWGKPENRMKMKAKDIAALK